MTAISDKSPINPTDKWGSTATEQAKKPTRPLSDRGKSSIRSAVSSSTALTLAEGKYEGEVRDGKPHGWGILNMKNGTRYEGEWDQGQKHGHGKETEPDGTVFLGSWESGTPVGYGEYIYSNGTKGSGW